jgi:hypothetical protein
MFENRYYKNISTLCKALLLITGIFFSNFTFSQTYKTTNWGINAFIGASNMMGDLGGSNFVGSRGIFDFDIRATRLAGGVGVSLIHGGISVGTNVTFTHLAGNDVYSTQDFQVERNLSVRTDLVEANLLLEWRPFSRTKSFNRFYLFGGIGGMYYQPKAKYNDEWYKLRTLGTEGQYASGGSGPYSELDIVIPYGLGYKFRLTPASSLILDFGFRKTFTDYLDDVSTVYADPATLTSDNGAIAAILADRSENGMAIGAERGNPDKTDMYFITTIKFEYILGGVSGDGCYYNRNPKKSRNVRKIQRNMFMK